MSIKLNIGSGVKADLPGFIPIDRRLGHEALPLPAEVDGVKIGTGTVDDIRASHILEHFSFGDVPRALAEWVRVLKPGGRIRIAVPDLDKINGECAADPLRLRYLMGGQQHADDFHRSAFTEATLRRYMEDAGLIGLTRWESANTDCAALPVSLNLEGFKADVPESQQLKICAIISIPRLGWNSHWGCVYESLAPWKMPIKRYTGAYWEHGIQELLEASEAPDVVLTLDYDTVFMASDFDKLLHGLCSNPQIDAIAGLQTRRRNDTPLCTVEGDDGANAKGATVIGDRPFKARTAHFGFTLIRIDALRKLPKPWFLSVPNALGGYRTVDPQAVEGVDTPWSRIRGQLAPFVPPHCHIDADIWFWKQWERAGNSLYVAPNVRVGHIEETVGDFDDELKPRRSHVTDWFNERTGREACKCE